MKKKKTSFLKRIKIISVAFAVVMLAEAIEALPVFAGLSETVIDNSSFAESISNTHWNNAGADVSVENGKIIFPNESTEDTRLITQTLAKKTEGAKNIFSAEYSIRFKQLPQGEKFILGFSLNSIEALPGEAGNLEVAFQNSGGIKADVSVYDEDSKKQVLLQPVGIGAAIGSDVKVQVYATTDMNLSITVNQKVIFNGKAPIDLTGRIGFLQTGNCGAEVDTLNIVTSSYTISDGCNATEDFERGSMNANAFYSKHTTASGYYPAAIRVEDYNSNKVLMFRNSYVGYFSTLHQYSNFEFTFDIPYMLHTEIKNELGETIQPAHSAFAVVFGKEVYDGDGWGVSDAHSALIFNNSSVSSLKDENIKENFSKEEFCDMSKNEGYSVRVIVQDTYTSVALKPLEGDTWTELLSYKMGETPIGYVQIRPYGKANFAVDNVKIVNKDVGSAPKEVEFAEGGMPGVEDWVYEPMEVKYRPTKQAEQEVNWYLLAAIVTSVAILLIVACVFIKQRKRKIAIGGKEDEKA